MVALEVRCAASVQNAAADEPPAWIDTPSWSIGPGKLGGQFGYDYVAQGRGPRAGLIVAWGPSKSAPGCPTARRFKLMVGSEPCWRNHVAGGNAATLAAETIAQLVGDLWRVAPPLDLVEVRRIDIAIDHWGYRWKRDDLGRFATRSRTRGSMETREAPADATREVVGPTSSTYYVGRRGGAGRMLRVYDKVAEAGASGKLPWMEPIWRANGWDGVATVWRAEVEHGGEWLRVHGMNSAAKLAGCEHALWRDYVATTRHTTAGRTRLKRSPTSQVWMRLRGAIRRAERNAGERAAWEWKPAPPRPAGDMGQLGSMAAGCLRRIRDAMFAGESDRPDLWVFMREALERADERARERAAQLARGGRKRRATEGEPAPPEYPGPPPPSR